VYLSFDGEVDLSELMEKATRSGKTIALPVVHGGSAPGMCFRRYRSEDPVRRNRFGIREPYRSDRRQIRPSSIGLVLMPVVGFDPSGTRLGMVVDSTIAILLGWPSARACTIGWSA